jgi:hypothetical protein
MPQRGFRGVSSPDRSEGEGLPVSLLECQSQQRVLGMRQVGVLFPQSRLWRENWEYADRLVRCGESPPLNFGAMS